MKIKVDDLQIGMTIIFKGETHVITDLCQCGTTKLTIYVDNMNDIFARLPLNKEVEIERDNI